MELSLQNIACAAGLALMISGLIGAWVETRLKVKTLMRNAEVIDKRYREDKKQQAEKANELLESLHGLRQEFTERLGEINTTTATTAQRLDDLVEQLKRNGVRNA